MTWFSKKTEPEVRDNMGLQELLREAEKTEDPKYAHRLLTRAEVLAPDSLDVQRALLMHGRLHERDSRTMDYSVIKSYLFHAFEHPEKHSEEEQRRMARELFDDRRLKLCLELSPDQEAFLKDYLEDLAKDYMRIFVAADSSHSPRVLGMGRASQLYKYLAKPASDIILNLLSSPYLSAQEQVLAASAFYRAFYRAMDGQVKELNSALGDTVCQTLR